MATGAYSLTVSGATPKYNLSVVNGSTLNLTMHGPSGRAGRDAYQSYLDTTTDDPPLSEAEWSEGGGSAPGVSPTPPPNPTPDMLWTDSTDGSLNQWDADQSVWVNLSHEVEANTGIVQIGFLGDSITETASEWAYECFIGTGFNAVWHRARFNVADITEITVTHVNAGANQSLSVSVTGSGVTVNLATDGSGVVTSTVTNVRDACNASAPYLALGLLSGIVGSSQLAQAGAAKHLAPYSATTADGYAAWLQLLSNGRFEFIRFDPTTYAGLLAGSWTFGKSGLTTASIITYILPDVLLLCAGKTVVEMSGANDLLSPGYNEATTQANRVSMWTQMQAAGITVIACEVLPMIEGGLVPVGLNANAVSLNAALKIEAATLSIQWIEWPATLFDGAEAEATLWEVDGIHPNPAACQIMGAHVLTEIGTVLSANDFPFPSATSARWISANPYMAGGTTIATGWTAPSAYSPATITPSLVTIGGRQWQRLTVVQPASFKLALMNQSATTVATGQVIRIAAQMKVSAGFKNVRARLTFTGADGEVTAHKAINTTTEMASADFTVALTAHDGVWLSPPEVVPYGATAATLSIWSFGAGTVDIGVCGLIDTEVVEGLVWPTSPTDGDVITEGGIEWIYTASANKWSRYAEPAGAGGVSSWNDLTDRPAGLLSAQAAATESIRAIGTTATTAMAGNATPTPAAHTHVSANITDLATASVGTSAALVFGAIDPLHAVSMSYIDDRATFALGSEAAHALRVALIAPSRDEAGNVTIALTDHAVPIRMTSGSAAAITIPNDSTVAFPDGFIVYFRRHGAGALSLTLGAGVTVNNSVISSIAVGGTFALMWTAANTWDFI